MSNFSPTIVAEPPSPAPVEGGPWMSRAASWHTDAGNRVGTAHLFVQRRHDVVRSKCGREVLATDLQPLTEAIGRCARCASAAGPGARPLTPAQRTVMQLLSQRRQAEVTLTGAVHIDGQRACNIDTMLALQRRGLVRKCDQWRWCATELGLAWKE